MATTPRLLLATLSAAALGGGLLTGAAEAAAPPGTPSASCPWVGSTAPVEQRVNQVLALMSIGEEITMVHGAGGPYVGNVPANTRLCIPAMNLEDGPGGVADGLTGVTQLPASVSAAATWDTALTRQYGDVIGAEEAGKGANVNLGPTVNIVRDPRWGRAFESMGEDPYLAGQQGSAYIQGVQGQGVLAQVKHLAVYNQETNRNTPADNAIVDERAMQEIYLPQFQAAVTQGGASSVMCSYSSVNGPYACESPYLQNTVLKGQFGFTGFVTSDWGATHSTVNSANNGLDQQMPDAGYFGAPLQAAVQGGQVPRARLDDMVRRILRQLFRFGLFDRAPSGSTGAVVTSPQHAALARQVAEQGTVLLKNAGGALPLDTTKLHSVAVIGDDAGSHAQSSGGGSASVTAPYVVTPLQGIRDRAGSGVNVQYAQGVSNNGLPAVPTNALRPATGGGSGLTGQYFGNMTMSGSPVLTKTDATVDFDFHGGSPGQGLGGTGWSAKWTGTVTPPVSGSYTFSLNSDDGSRLLVGGQRIIDNWGDHAPLTVTGTVTLTANQPVPIEVDYYQNGGGSNVTLGWQPPGSSPIGAAADLARNSDVAVVFASDTESEGGDLTGIDLPGQQNQLIAAVAAANPHTIVVLNTGSAVTMPWVDQVAGVAEAWYPGQEDGNAIASVLFGDVNPSGKLPVTFPKSLADVPANTAAQWPGVNGQVQYSEGLGVGYRWYDTKNIAPLFPFGHGLSYTSFAFGGLQISAPGADGSATVSATVTNTGQRAGADVVQLYVGHPGGTGEPPKQLRHFQRVDLAPGQSQVAQFTVTAQDLAYWNVATHGWVTPSGTYRIMLGDSSANLPLAGDLPVTGGGPIPGTGPIVGIAGLCVDVANASTANGTSVQTYTCNGSAAQTWTVGADGTLRALGKCMDVNGGGVLNGTKVQLYDCNGTGAQVWQPQPNGALRNPQSGRCLDVPAANTTPGSQLQLYDCNGTNAQTWRLP
ncbi:glycosyl hydrolase [Solihabitans fulvus]|uniref:Probable beta-glucosidase G n=1 Tax=Solihabitans fulvus TaxID=1892852 RepID=A0A5B2WUD4_9PSEU|nr:glycoside hydrolase family 3 C-terminal domain-containing protein [Solihabitans fulvus]KAA2254484.1 glycosyl hydrolase [Solihabitans fulvus]